MWITFLALFFVIAVTGAVGTILSLNRKLQKADDRLKIVNRELTHRLKNVFAIAQSLAAQSFKNTDLTGEARQNFAGRMETLSRGAALLSEEGWAGTDLVQLVKALGLPMSDRVKMHGPYIHLGPASAQSFALLFHELWTNACKHGALVGDKGHILMSWDVTANGEFRFLWSEVGTQTAKLTAAPGFGRTLVERLVPMQLGGTAKLSPSPDGLVYELRSPAKALGD